MSDDPLIAELLRIEKAVESGKSYGFQQSIWRDVRMEIERLQATVRGLYQMNKPSPEPTKERVVIDPKAIERAVMADQNRPCLYHVAGPCFHPRCLESHYETLKQDAQRLASVR